MHKKGFLPLEEKQEYYYINRKIHVLSVCVSMHVAKIKIKETGEEFWVDISAISKKIIFENSVSIKWLGGE